MDAFLCIFETRVYASFIIKGLIYAGYYQRNFNTVLKSTLLLEYHKIATGMWKPVFFFTITDVLIYFMSIYTHFSDILCKTIILKK